MSDFYQDQVREQFKAAADAKRDDLELYFERHGRADDWRLRKPLPVPTCCPMCGENYLRCRCGGGE